jgi:hypothetical protein
LAGSQYGDHWPAFSSRSRSTSKFFVRREKHSVNFSSIAPEILAEIIRRIVAVANPQRIILFGSAARAQMNRNSDVSTQPENLSHRTLGVFVTSCLFS